MSNFKQYKRTGLSEMKPWKPSGKECELTHLILQNISISQADIDNKSPKLGDMIARNPDDHTDTWLVAKEYFEANFERVATTTNPLPNGTRVRLLSDGGYFTNTVNAGSTGNTTKYQPETADKPEGYYVDLDLFGGTLFFYTNEVEAI